MRLARALRYGLYDRILAVGSLLLGLAIALGAIWVGAGDWLTSGDLTSPPGGQSGLIVAAGVLAGLFVWQLGSTAARYRTLVSATGRELSGATPDDVDGDLDARIGQLESDVEEVRRVAARIEQSMRTDEMDGADLTDRSSASDDAASAGAGAGATAGASGAGSAGGATGDAPTVDETPSGDTTESTDAGAADASTGTADDGASTADAGAAETADATTEGTTGDAEGVQIAGDAAATGGATGTGDDASEDPDASTATADEPSSAADGGTTDDVADDPFEWPEEDEDGEYYRNS